MGEIDYRNVFQNSAAEYEKITATKHIRLIYELEKQVLSELFERIGSEDKSVMDFACGSGRWTQFLEGHFKSCLGVDVSGDMIGLAKGKCDKADFVVTDITSEAVDQKVKDKQFDVITTFRFFKNAEQPLRQAATDALIGYLKDDGVLIFDLHLNTWSFMGMLACLMRGLGLKKLLGIGDLTVRTISLGDIKRLFETRGLEVVDYWGMGVMPGRANYTLLPWAWLRKLEGWFTRKKIFRPVSYNLLVLARKRPV